jgi:hypothetical protein
VSELVIQLDATYIIIHRLLFRIEISVCIAGSERYKIYEYQLYETYKVRVHFQVAGTTQSSHVITCMYR